MFVIYSYEHGNPESDMTYMCTCNSKKSADYIVKSLKTFEDGVYDYYIKEL